MNVMEKLGLLMLIMILTEFVTDMRVVVFNFVVGGILFFYGGFIEEICTGLDTFTRDPKGGM